MSDPTPGYAAPGTPAWWAARSAVPGATPRGRGRPRRSFDDIVDAAVQVVDEHGADGFTMRLLADRLGTSTATLYRHASGKEELVVHVVDRVLGDVLGGVDDPAPTWQDALRRVASAYRALLAEHPNVLPPMVAQLPVGPNALALRERSLAELTGFGLSPALAARAFTTLVQYVVGQATTGPGSPDPDEASAIAGYYRSLDAARYPHVAAAADVLTAASIDDEFRAGVEIVLAGIDRIRGADGP